MESIKFSPLIIGTMRLGEWGAKLTTPQLEKFVEECIEMGLTDFDHADIYGHYSTENDFGKLLKQRPDLRNKMQITSKSGVRLVCEKRPQFTTNTYDNSKNHLITSAENSLKELNTDHLDLFLVHRPDYLMNPYEIAEALELLIKQGKTKHVGVSNFTTHQFDLLNSLIPLSTNQVEISILHLDPFEDGTLIQCQKHKVVPTAWSPFGAGAVFQKSDEARIGRIQILGNKYAEKYNTNLDQILLAWLMRHPSGIIPVLGTSKIERVRDAKKSLKIELTREEWYSLWKASTGKEID